MKLDLLLRTEKLHPKFLISCILQIVSTHNKYKFYILSILLCFLFNIGFILINEKIRNLCSKENSKNRNVYNVNIKMSL